MLVKNAISCLRLLVLALSLFPNLGQAATKYWIGTSGGAFATGANWSTTAGSACGTNANTTAPGSTDVATFDTCTNNVALAAAVDVAGINITTNYSGTLTQNAGVSVTVGTSNYSQAAGVFAGSNAAIAMNGTFALSGGVFTSTSATLTIITDWTMSGGIFFHNSGTIQLFNSRNQTINFTGTRTLNNIIIGFNSSPGGNYLTIANGTIVTVNGTITFPQLGYYAPPMLIGGSIIVNGDINLSNFGTGAAGNGASTTIFTVAGSGAQKITGTGGLLPPTVINKPSGILTLSGTMSIVTDFTYSAGTVNSGTSTVLIYGAINDYQSVNIYGSFVFNNLIFQNSFRTAINLANGTTLTVNGLLGLSSDSPGYSPAINGGAIAALGNISVAAAGATGTTPITFSGAANQTFTSLGGSIPGTVVTLNKSAGTVSLASNMLLSATQALTITNGTLAQGSSNYALQAGAISVGISGFWTNTGTGGVTLGGNVSNAGSITISGGGGAGCGGTFIPLRSTVTGTRRSWSGAGAFVMKNVSVSDQGGNAGITADTSQKGWNLGANWTFTSLCSSIGTGTAQFVKFDTTTQGTWKGVYGSDGYNIIGENNSYPSYANVFPAGNSQYLWNGSTSDVRALQKSASTTDRLASVWYSATSFSMRIINTDGQKHSLALYALDWDTTVRRQQIAISDTESGTLLDLRSLSSFDAGTWTVWTISGDVTVTVTNNNNVINAVLSGLFFDPAPVVSSPGAFNAFESTTTAGALVGNVHTKVSGTAFSVDAVVLNIGGTAVLTSFTGDVKVELLNASNNTGGFTGSCRASWSAISGSTPVTLTFAGSDAGRKAVTLSEPEAWRDVRVRLSTPATGTATVVSCSTDNFAIRPAAFASFSATDADWATAGTTRTVGNTSATGGNVHKAGNSFTVRATAVNSAGATTANYVGSPTASTSACAGTGCPAALGTLTLATAAVAGVINQSATYSEAGSFTLALNDTSFAAVDAADGSSSVESTVASPNLGVGRFVPHHFDLTPLTSPQLKTFDSTACLAVRSFTYLGQPFGYVTAPQANVLARNAAGSTTANYTGALWKLTAAGLTQTYVPTPTTPAVDASAIGAPTLTSNSNGTGLLVGAAGDKIGFIRPSAVLAPFNASIALTWSIQDSTEAAVSGNGTLGTTTPLVFSNIGFDSGSAFRFGVLRMTPTYGNELVNLPVPVEAQYWDGARMATNVADSCTSFATSAAALSNYQRNLSACKTAIVPATLTLASGRTYLRLIKPGTGNSGSVDLALQVGASAAGSTCTAVNGPTSSATTASLPWLQGKWSGAATFANNPAARASFGQYRSPLLYLRELY